MNCAKCAQLPARKSLKRGVITWLICEACRQVKIRRAKRGFASIPRSTFPHIEEIRNAAFTPAFGWKRYEKRSWDQKVGRWAL